MRATTAVSRPRPVRSGTESAEAGGWVPSQARRRAARQARLTAQLRNWRRSTWPPRERRRGGAGGSAHGAEGRPAQHDVSSPGRAATAMPRTMSTAGRSGKQAGPKEYVVEKARPCCATRARRHTRCALARRARRGRTRRARILARSCCCCALRGTRPPAPAPRRRPAQVIAHHFHAMTHKYKFLVFWAGSEPPRAQRPLLPLVDVTGARGLLEPAACVAAPRTTPAPAPRPRLRGAARAGYPDPDWSAETDSLLVTARDALAAYLRTVCSAAPLRQRPPRQRPPRQRSPHA